MFIILPNQLFDYLSKEYKYILYEHPLYFSHSKRSDQFHIQKLILHRASMKYYYDRMREKGYNIFYYEFKRSFDTKKITHMFTPSDKIIEEEFKHVSNIVDSPMFLHTLKDLSEYKGGLFHHTFKNWSIEKLKLSSLDIEKSHDEENRSKISNDELDNVPTITKWNNDKINRSYIEEAIRYINTLKIKTYGFCPKPEDFLYPISRDYALKNLDLFIKNRFFHFGKYQDSIVSDQKESQYVLYHSFISSSLNNGLITPKDVIDRVKKQSIKNKIPINSYEGFLRQIIGWREYMRYCYEFHYKEIITSNYFSNNNSLDNKWYSNDKNVTGVDPVDECIVKAYNCGYLHHIERLMIILNWMTLNEIHPRDMYKWFMSCVSIDAYDWVMVSNIYIFSYAFNKASRKPYISSSSYVLKMSNYKKQDEWCQKWDNLYRKFLKNKKEKFRGTIYYTQAVKL